MVAVSFLSCHLFSGVFRPWHKHASAEGEGAWIYVVPEHSASRAQGNVQTLGDDTCTWYQVLLDNTRDAGRRTVRPRLFLISTHLCTVVAVHFQNLVTVCLAQVGTKENTSTHQPCTVTLVASREKERERKRERETERERVRRWPTAATYGQERLEIPAADVRST